MDEKKKHRFYTTFTFLFFYLPIILVIIFFTVTFIFFYNRQKNLAYQKVLSDLHSQTITYEENLNLFLAQKQKQVENISLFFSNYKLVSERKRRNFFKQYLYDLQYIDNDVFSFWTAFKPYTIDSYDDNYKDKVENITGQFIYTVYRVNQHIDEKPVDINDYEKLSHYLKKIRQTKKANIFAPVQDSNEVLTGVKYLVRFVSPIVNNGNIVGIVGMDINPFFFDNFFNKDDNIIILNNNFNIIYNSQHENIGKNFLEVYTYYPKIDELTALLSSGKNYRALGNFNDIHKKNFYDVMFFSPANQRQKWIIINLKDENYIKKSDTSNYFIVLVFLFIGALVIIFTVYVYINYLRKYLNEIKEYLNKLFTSDELEIKYHYFNDLANNLNNKIRDNRKTIVKTSEIIQKLKEEEFDIEIPFDKQNIIFEPIESLRNKLKTDKETYLSQLAKQERDTLLVNATASVNDILRENIDSLENLSYEIIKFLSDFTNAIQAGFYVINEEEKILELTAFYSYNRKVYHKKKIDFGEGMVGACALELKPVFTKIPDDYLEITSGLGKEKPNFLYIVPLVYNDVLYGIIELSFIDNPEKYFKDFVVNISPIIASTLGTSKNNERTKILLARTEQIRKEMERKEASMKNQVQELKKLQVESKKLQLEYKAIHDSIIKIAFFAEFDTESTILYINEGLSEAIQFTFVEASLLTYYELFNITEVEKHKRYWKKVLQGDSVKLEFPIYLATRTVWINGVLSPVYNIEGEIYKVIFLGTDYTELRQKEQELNKLMVELTEKAEQLNVQELEMDAFIEEFTNLQEEVTKLREENQRLNNTSEFLKKEMEKRVRRAKKIQVTLNQKIKKLEQELRNLRGE